MRKEEAQHLLLAGLERLGEEEWIPAAELLEKALGGLKEAGDPALLVLCLEGLEKAAAGGDMVTLGLRVVREREGLAGVLSAGSDRERAANALDRASLLLDLGRYGESERESRRALAWLGDVPERTAALAYLGLSLLKQGEPGSALEALAGELSRTAGEGLGVVYGLQGVSLCNLGRCREAVPVLEAAVERFDPEGGEVLIATLSLCVALARSGEGPAAVERLLALSERDEAPRHLRIESLLQAVGILAGGWDEGAEALASGLEGHRGQPVQDQAAYANLLQLCAEMRERPEEAARWFAAPGDPGRSPCKLEALAHLALGLTGGRPEGRAAELLSRALDLLAEAAESSQLAILVDRARERLGSH